MTALGKLLRTTVFKLSLAYLVMFALGAGAVVASMGYNVRNLIDEQISSTIEAEITGLAEQYGQGGIRRLVDSVQRRAGQPGSSLYLVTTFAGETIAGNVEQIPPGILDRPGVADIAYQRIGEQGPAHQALARIFVLPGGFRLLVGRDLEDRETLRRVLGRTLLTSLFWLTVIGVAGGIFVAMRVLRRVDAMSASAQTIMAGDLSRRLPLAGTGDELDRLAQNLNAMLDRIDELMKAMREVSDNVAHDLRTPLTRLRNGAEQALRADAPPAERKSALNKVIEESDGLIRVFDALLTIARLEAGSDREGMSDFDATEAARDMADLYEPLVEERGASLDLDLTEGLFIHANRELIGRALANLIDNALKYGKPAEIAPDGPKPAIRIATRHLGDRVEIEVADHGDGVPASDRIRVLDRFVRLEGSRTAPGSGLGLSLVAAVTRLHKGELRLEDNQPGLRVVMNLPAGVAPRVEAALVASEAAS